MARITNPRQQRYQKATTLKQAAELKKSKKPIRLGVRLHNLFRMMVMLAIHIGS